jgi:hypothetical protein
MSTSGRMPPSNLMGNSSLKHEVGISAAPVSRILRDFEALIECTRTAPTWAEIVCAWQEQLSNFCSRRGRHV